MSVTQDVLRPMLASRGSMPEGPGWAYEFAWDGVRSVAVVERDGVRVVNGDDRARCPDIDALASRVGDHRVVLDGEIVAPDAVGRPSRPGKRTPVVYCVFDLLAIDESSTATLPYRKRRALLEQLDLTGAQARLAPSFHDVNGQAVLAAAEQYGLRGVVAKHVESPYRPGRRSGSWVETLVRETHQVVVGGWVPGATGDPSAVGSLLVGIPTNAGLRYLGRVSSGLREATRCELPTRLHEATQSPFADQVPVTSGRAPHWVAPRLVGEVSYRGWTSAGHLGHPAWRGPRPGTHPAAVRAPVVLPEPRRPVRESGSLGREELTEQVERARAEVEALRTQISPHFLYNALNAIASVLRTDQEEAGELLTDFADFTRYSLDSEAEFSTVGEETGNIERYLTLEGARLGDRLGIDLRVDTGVLDVAVPHLAVQLLVMNAVRYGVEPHTAGGTVTITAAASEDRCTLTVADSGASLDVPEARAGLATVEQRLRAALGDDYRLYTDTGTSGTTVTLEQAVTLCQLT